MDQKSNYSKVKKVAHQMAKDLAERMPLEQAILFGSYAKGTAHEDSDIDLVFVSPYFAGMDGFKRFDLISPVRKSTEFAIDYFGLTPQEYENASPQSALAEVKETGQVIYPFRDFFGV